jgi:hypothetical protein
MIFGEEKLLAVVFLKLQKLSEYFENAIKPYKQFCYIKLSNKAQKPRLRKNWCLIVLKS